MTEPKPAQPTSKRGWVTALRCWMPTGVALTLAGVCVIIVAVEYLPPVRRVARAVYYRLPFLEANQLSSERQTTMDAYPAWRSDLEAALEEAVAQGKPVMVDFAASWCPPCREMEASVWPDPAVRQAISESVIPLQVNIDRHRNLAARFGIEYVPTILLLTPQGEELARSHFMDADRLIHFLSAVETDG